VPGDPESAAHVEPVAQAMAALRASGHPLQYVTGTAAFRHLDLVVGPGVFIPRPETELVAGRAMELLPPGGTLLEAGTGSGAIALAIATERSDARVIATEVSQRAVRYAFSNRELIGARLDLVCCDLFAAITPRLRGAVDVVVSNPPYVPPEDRSLVARDVLEHEPHSALFAEGRGLGVIRRLVAEAHVLLRAGGWLVFEIGDRQGPQVRSMLESQGYEAVDVARDLTGRERIAEGRRGAGSAGPQEKRGAGSAEPQERR
jgi:release factor glutamine methyltransferase